MTETVLEIEGLEVRYGGVAAVRGLSFTVGKGEIVGLIGPNGAGKSSTLHSIVGLTAPRGGDIRFAGRSIRGHSPERITRSGIVLVPEGRRIFADFTVEENIELGLVGRGDRAGREQDLAWVYELFPIVKDFRKRRAGVLSGGQQQQLAIARALVTSPQVLLLDEPSLGLAPKLVDTVFDVLAQIRERGVSILLVEQRAVRTVAFATRTHVISNGALRMTLTPENAHETERMIAAYLGS